MKLPAAVWQTYPHTGSLEIATAAVCVWHRMVDHANDGHLLPPDHAPSGSNDSADS